MISSELFQALSPLVSLRQSVPPGDYLFRKGDPAQYVFVVTQGSISVESDISSNRNLPIKSLVNKKLWGIREIVLNAHYPYCGKAETEVSIQMIPRSTLYEAFKSNPSLKLMVMQAIAREITQLPHTVLE